MRIINRYLKPYYWRMAGGFAVKFFGTVMDLLLPWILAYIIDEVVVQNDINKVLLWGLVMLLCAICAVLGNVIANRMASAVARDSARTIRNDLFRKIQDLSCNQVDHFTESSLISRMTTDTYNLHNFIGRMQRLGVRAPILLFGGIVVTMTLDPVLSLILIATLPFLGIVVFFVSKKGVPLYSEQQTAADKLIRKVRESITGIRVLKALSKTAYEKGEFEKINSNVVRKEKKAGMIMAVTNPVMNFLLNMGWVVLIVVGAYRVNAGLTQPGKIIAFLTYFTIILNAMLSITRIFVMYSKASASAYRIGAVLDECRDLQQIDQVYAEEVEKKACMERNGQEEIAFENVTFSYNGKMNNVENVSFELEKGQTLGIIGATGSGKTTLANLMMRFYDADSGSVRIAGQDVRKYTQEELHQKFGVVFQNDTLFEDTVYENINLGRNIDHKTIQQAAGIAQIHDHIESMENGYDSFVAIKGANMSGGQKQRLLIARALANHPEILILDDSSSALDYKTDALMRNEIRKQFLDTTIVIVAQRVSSVMNADRILVIDEGKIIAQGTHEELLKNCEEYKNISQLQLGTEAVS